MIYKFDYQINLKMMKKALFLVGIFIWLGLDAQSVQNHSEAYPDYFISGSYIGYPKGHGNVKLITILYDEFQVGITNNFSAGMGISWVLGLFASVLAQKTVLPVMLHTKISFPIKNQALYTGVGFSYIGLIDLQESGVLGIYIPKAGITIGSPLHNISFNLYAPFHRSLPPTQINFWSLSGKTKISRKTHLMGEIIVMHSKMEKIYWVIGGMQTRWRKVALDYGLIKVPDSSYPFPHLALRIPF